MVGRKDLVYLGASTSSMCTRSSGLIEEIHPSLFRKGVCRTAPLSQSSNRVQLIKMLCLNVLPILGLWCYTVYTLTDSVNNKEDYNKWRSALYTCIDLGKLTHRLQVERDMSVLYLSSIGPDTKSFLMNVYSNTDSILLEISWAPDIDEITGNTLFTTKKQFQVHLNDHRKKLEQNNVSIHDEIQFYSTSIDAITTWMHKKITESQLSLVWKLLVAFQKLTSAKESLGVERALGTMFYAQGGFETQEYFERYNKRVHSFRAFMRSIGMYSAAVYDIYEKEKENFPIEYLSTVERFRNEIQGAQSDRFVADLQKAQFFFDNMTIYLDILYETQLVMVSFVISKFNNEIDGLTREIIINAVLLVIVILLCPVVILATESLTSSIQTYAITLVDKTKELNNERKRTDGLLYQMVPKQIAEMLKRRKKVDAEFFKMVTICFTDVYDFDKLTTDLAPMEIVDLLNHLYNTVDGILDSFDIYKVETINDCYLVASGVPRRNKDRHVYEIAEFSLAMLETISSMTLLAGGRQIQLRIGINSGPCMAGIVGTIMPRYCLFGDTINTASRMKAYSEPNKIHLSKSANQLLGSFKTFQTRARGSVNIKGKGDMRTFWLIGRREDTGTDVETCKKGRKQKLSTTSEMPNDTMIDSSVPSVLYNDALDGSKGNGNTSNKCKVVEDRHPEGINTTKKQTNKGTNNEEKCKGRQEQSHNEGKENQRTDQESFDREEGKISKEQFNSENMENENTDERTLIGEKGKICKEQYNNEKQENQRSAQSDHDQFPGEITTIESPTYSAALRYPMPGRQAKRWSTAIKSLQQGGSKAANTVDDKPAC